MFKHASTNRFYRLVWSHVNACWVAVAEGARGRGKSGRARRAAAVLGGLLAAGGALAANAPAPGALPNGAVVVAGQAQVTTSGNTMTVNQATAQAILNWQGFDIGAQAAVRFNQPSASAVALNRVVGNDPSRIYGQLSSNGKVFLINQQGVLFGAGAQVNVGGLVASSLGLSDQDFLSGRYDFSGTSTAGAVRNEGSIRAANGGFVALLAPSVSNSGSISAQQGSVALAAGERIGMDLRGDGLITVQVTRGALAAAVANQGVIQADGGAITLTASAADALARSSVNNTGLVQARGFGNGNGGSIELVADQVQAGKLDVSSRAAQGGSVGVSGAFVALDGTIDASGARGGKVAVDASGTLSLAASTDVHGSAGQGGAVAYHAGTGLVETADSVTNASGATNGGSISVVTDGALLSSGQYQASGSTGNGGRIDVTGASVRLLGATLDASGATQGGLVRVGGAFQGGLQRADVSDSYRYTGRWGQLAPLATAQQTFISDSTTINVAGKGAAAQGGTAVVWSNEETTMLGKVNASGGAAGGAVEISSKGDLRYVSLDGLNIGAGGSLLLDPKNITIGNYPNVWTYEAMLGKGFSSGKSLDLPALAEGDSFGSAVALNSAGDRLAVGAPMDDGADLSRADSGVVRLFSFSSASFAGATLQSSIGYGYTGGKNLNLSSLAADSQFGSSVAFNATNTRLAVGALGEDGHLGTVHQISFTDSNFSGASEGHIIHVADFGGLSNANAFGSGLAFDSTGTKLAVGALLDSTGANNGGMVHLFTTTATTASYVGGIAGFSADQQFGTAVALSADASKLAVGAVGADNSKGAVYLYTTPFATPALAATLGNGYTGGKNINVTLADGAMFGSSVAFDTAGTRLAVGASAGGGFGSATAGAGNVRVFDFGANFASGSISAVLGRDYTVGANADITMADADGFGYAVALDGTGTHMIIGAPFSASQDGTVLGAGSVHAYSLLPQPLTSNQIFNSTKPRADLDVTIDAARLATTLGSGVSVTLQASNNIAVSSGNPINVTSNGGSLTLQAGNSITIDSSITTHNGNLTLVANETNANGVVSANRDAGNATINVSSGAFVDTGTGNISMTIANGLGNTQKASGDLVINGHLTGNAITLRNQGITTGSDIVIGATGVVAATGVLEAAAAGAGGGTFTNSGTFGSTNRYLIYSDNPTNTIEGLTGYNKHYNQTFTAGSTPGYAGSGNWIFYTVAPTLTLTANAQTRAYDGTTTPPTLTFGSTGYIDGDTASIFTGALGVTGASKNVGTYAIGIGTLAQSLGYGISYTGNNFTITQKSITPTAAATNKVYDRTTAASFTVSSAGKIAGDTLTFGGTGSFADKNVGTAKTIAISGIALGGADAANYALTGTTATASADITARTLNATATGVNKTYDGTLAATATLGNDKIAGDTITLSGTAAFGDKNVGTGKTVGVTGIAIGGADAGNYTLASTTATTTANITAKTLTATATGVDKVYDGATTATATYGDDRVAGDTVTVSGTASFANKNVGNAKAVSVSGIALSGTDAGNYTLAATTASTSANITPRTLNASATGVNKTYDGTLAATATYGSDKVAGDTVTLTGTAAFGDKNVGTGKTVGVTGIAMGGADAGNYTLASTTTSTTANISAKTLTATATGVNKTYDATTAATATLGDDRVGGDVLTVSGTAAFGNKNVGTGKAVTVSGLALSGTDAGNYTLASTTAATTANISAKTLTATATGVNKVYDGATTASASYGDDRIAGDVLAVTGTATFGNKNVGTGKAVSVSGIALSGTDAGNYTLASTTASTSADITARTLNATATGVNKTYDGGTGATTTYGSDKVAGDVITLTGTAAFGDKNVGTGKTVGVTGIAMGGADAGNYTLASTTASTTANISAKTLNATATGVNKIYDGATTATASYGDDRVAGDIVTVSGNASFGNKNVGTAKAVTVTGIALSGTDAGNYTLASTSAATSADITARTLNATATGINKTYDGTLAATATYGSDKVAGDTVTLTGTAAFGDKNVGTGKTVGVTGIAMGGADAGNYTLASTTASTTANISAKTLTATATGVNKTYDATTAATATLGDDRVAGDVLTVSGNASFGNKNVGTGKAVTVSGLALSGTDAGNYTLASTTAATTANISAKTLTATATGVNKVYDGATTGSASYGDDRIAGDVLAVTGTATFGNKNVGTGKAVSVSGIALSGTDAANYTLASTTASTSADVTARTLNATATGVNKIYDATSAASATYGSDKVAGDVVTLTGNASFGDKNVGTGKAVTVTGIAIGGADAGNYTLASTTAATTANISAKTLTATAAGVNRVYDGSTAATATFGDDRIAGDVLAVSGNASFANKNVGNGKAVSVAGMALSGTDAGNYVLASTTTSTSANITARTLNASATGINKTYDGTIAATATYGSDKVAGDVVTVNGVASFGDKNAGVGKAVGVTGITIGGADAGNYTLASTTASTSANISAKTLNATAAGVNKTYDGTTAASATFGDDRIAGDTLAVSGTASFGDKNVGIGKAVAVNGMSLSGADAGNYTLASTTSATTANIGAKTLTATATGINKVYDGATTATASYGDDRVAGDVLAVTGTASFGDKNVGNGKAVSVAGIAISGADAGNYALASTTAATTASITPRTLNATATGVNKTYDGTTAATAIYGSDKVAGDVINLSGVASFQDKNVAAVKAVSVGSIAISGADAGNYTLASTTASTTASISAKTLSATATGLDKVYDGATTAAATFGDDRVAGDVLAVNGNASFADKNAGAGKAVTVSGLALSGTDAGNYTLAATTVGTTAAITPKALSASLSGTTSKVYDGSTAAAIAGNSIALTGFVGAESATASGISGAYNSANVIGATSVSAALQASNLTAGSGTSLANYVVPATVSGSGAITPKAVTVGGLTPAAKVYDGSTVATLSGNGSLTGLVGVETLTLGAPTVVSFDTRSAGTGKTVTASGYTLANGSGQASNYVLASSSATASNGVITPASLVLTADDKTRNIGMANPAFTFTANGLVGGDTVALLSGVSGSTTAGVLSPIGSYPITLGGAALNDYAVSYVAGTLKVNGPLNLLDTAFRFAAPETLVEPSAPAGRDTQDAGADDKDDGSVVLRGGTRVAVKRRGLRAPQ